MKQYTTTEKWCDNLTNYLSDKKEHLAIVLHEKTEVGYGDDGDVNLDYLIDNNIYHRYRGGTGGTIVYCKGNISLAFVYNNRKYKEFVLTRMLDELCEHFKTLDLNASRNRNDILIDGYKVASGAAINLEPDFKWTYEMVQISIHQDIELIKNACLKPMAKEPKALVDYGITTDYMLAWIEDWFSKNNLVVTD